MVRLGTSSWTAEGWNRAFYPERLPPRDYIAYYSKQFNTVEIDATFYAIPAARTVQRWYEATEPGFLFAAKVPQEITHERLLLDCEMQVQAFVDAMSGLREKLGPLLFQFRYFRKGEIELDEFVSRLSAILGLVPEGMQVAVETRNKTWLREPLLGLLRDHGVALALIDHPYMPFAGQYRERVHELITTDFTYIRWLGDRQRTEDMIAKVLGEISFEKSVVDREPHITAWVELIRSLDDDRFRIFGYFNNHYSGYAINDLRRLQQLLGIES